MEIIIPVVIFFAVMLLSNILIFTLTPLFNKLFQKVQSRQAQKVTSALEDAFIWPEKKTVMLPFVVPLVLAGAVALLVKNPLFLIAGLFFAITLPGFFARAIRASRIKKFASQLVDSLMILTSSLKGGLSFVQAIEVLCEEMPAPASQEFGLVLKENKMGISLEDSLRALAKRMPIEELNLFVTAVLVAKETGGELTVVFSRLTETIRDNIKLKEKINTLTLQGRLQGVIMSILPIVFAFFVWKQNPDHFDVMLQSDIGRGLLILAVVLQLLGMFLIKRMSVIRI